MRSSVGHAQARGAAGGTQRSARTGVWSSIGRGDTGIARLPPYNNRHPPARRRDAPLPPCAAAPDRAPLAAAGTAAAAAAASARSAPALPPTAAAAAAARAAEVALPPQLPPSPELADASPPSSPSPPPLGAAADGWTLSSYSSIDEALARGGEVVSLEHEAARLERLLAELRACATLEDKITLVEGHNSMAQLRGLESHAPLFAALAALPPAQRYAVAALPAIGQAHLLLLPPADGGWAQAVAKLAAALERVEAFYDSMGGLVGYQLKSLQLILGATPPSPQQQQADGEQQQPQQQQQPAETVTYHVPPALDLAGEAGSRVGARAAAHGVLALPFMAEVLPVGGAGDRLGLRDDVTGEPLPAAVLPYAGRPMIEGLVRDLQAREYLYWRLTGRQVATPLAVMTSDAKGNHARITRLLERSGWFGRDPGSFRLFRQPLVPVLSTEDGKWLMTAPLKPMMKPGGHGAIWKLMHDEGVFDWLRDQGREAALVRQISNPMAGVDTTLLALAGTGYMARRAFGFMSCERAVGAAEGMNVLQERRTWDAAADGGSGGWRYEYGITNVEYTEFERLGMADVAADGGDGGGGNNGASAGRSAFPANTNILYVGLEAARARVEAAIAAGGGDVLPGLIFNLKKKVKYFDPLAGAERAVYAGRMECTMQNLADALTTRAAAPLPLPAPGGAAGQGDGLADALNNGAAGAGGGAGAGGSTGINGAGAGAPQLDTFLVYNLRRKVTSSAKKRREPGSARIAQTPDGSFYDLMRNAWQVLQRCGMRCVPEVGSVEDYLARGPGFIFLFHPALGPLWDVVAQKIRGGALMDGSELVLEVAEARLVDVTVDGSLLVHADNVMGHHQPAAAGDGGGAGDGAGGSSAGRLQYSAAAGRVHMLNVTVQNVGVDWHHPGNVYWRHRVSRHEACRVILRGRSEFEAFDCRITGDATFEVPDGYRMVVTAGPRGRGYATRLVPLARDAPSWEWRYSMAEGGDVRLEFARNAALLDLFVGGAGAGAGMAAVGAGVGAAGGYGGADDEDALLDFII